MSKHIWRISMVCMATLLVAAAALAVGEERPHLIPRGIPIAQPQHPGNVFLEGEEMAIPVPEELRERATRWRMLDDRLGLVAEGDFSASTNHARVRGAGIGWYRIEFTGANADCLGFTTAAVLARLAEPVPQDSPICLDAALSWLAEDSAERLSGLAALAGVNWIRDRIRWREVEPEEGSFAAATKYDEAAALQHHAGLKVLQVFHQTPGWAADSEDLRGRAPSDLRHVYRFCKAMGERFRGTVQAWEPWNEGNAANFGGHTVDELCSLQKAAYLGFKAGDSEVTVGWNPIGGINSQPLATGILENETWPYYDTYNIHSYDWAHDYAKLWEPAREAACGRPVWVTECDRGLKALPDSPSGDFSEENDRRKAEFITQSYACSLYSGATRHFHFILGHYMEGDNSIQFGLLRKDLTPRRGYVALAALGRLLAGGGYLGRWRLDGQPDVHVYGFRARPDGVDRDVLVAWVEKPVDWDRRGADAAPWPLPGDMTPVAVYDYLGRRLGDALPQSLTAAPLFIVLPRGAVQDAPLECIAPSSYRAGTPSRVVLQLETPQSANIKRVNGWTQEHDRAIAAGQEAVIVAYNFGDAPVCGSIALAEGPEGWTLPPGRWEIQLEPLARTELHTQLHKADQTQTGDQWMKVRGDFGDAGKPVLAFRVVEP